MVESRLGILFDIGRLESSAEFAVMGGAVRYGYAAYRIFFEAIDTRQLPGCSLSDGDTNLTLAGRANQYCIAVESLDASKIEAVEKSLSRSNAKGLLPLSLRFLDDAHVSREPLVLAAHIDPEGILAGCKTEWVKQAWEQSREKHEGSSSPESLSTSKPLKDRAAPPEKKEQRFSARVKLSPNGTALKDLMRLGRGFCSKFDPILIVGSDAYVYYESLGEGHEKGWWLHVPLEKSACISGYPFREIILKPDENPDQMVLRNLQNAPQWCVALESFDPPAPKRRRLSDLFRPQRRSPLRELMRSGQPFDWHNRIVITYCGAGSATLFFSKPDGWILALPGKPYNPITQTGGAEYQIPLSKIDQGENNPEKAVSDVIRRVQLESLMGVKISH